MLLNARTILNPLQKTERILLAIEDITERKQAQASSARLAAIVESSDDAIIGKNLLGVVISWNMGAQQLFGYTAQEAMGQPVAILIPPDRLDEEPRMLEQLRQGKKMDRYQTIRRRKDGSRVDVSLTVSPIKDAQGRLIGASEIARDITERELLEAAIRQNEALSSTILEQAPSACISSTPNSACGRSTPGAAVVQRGEVAVGRDFFRSHHDPFGSEIGGQVADIFRHTLETGEQVHLARVFQTTL